MPRRRCNESSSAKGTFIIRMPNPVGTYCTSTRVPTGNEFRRRRSNRSASKPNSDGITCTVMPGSSGGAPGPGGVHTSTASPSRTSSLASRKVWSLTPPTMGGYSQVMMHHRWRDGVRDASTVAGVSAADVGAVTVTRA